MADEIFFDGIRYLSAGDAAHQAGLTRDYIARLCRENKVRGKQVGKNWYVSKESLDSFLVRQEHEHVARKEELARKRGLEYQNAIQQQGFAASAVPQPVAAENGASLLSSTPLKEFSKLQRSAETVLARRAGRSDTLSSAMERHPALQHFATNISAFGQVGAAPGGVADAAYALAPHAAVSVVTPLAEAMHKLTALLVAVALTFGTYSIVDPHYARVAYESLREAAAWAADIPAAIAHGELERWAGNAGAQLAAAASDPALAGSNILAGIGSFASSLQGYLDDAIYSIMFSGSSFAFLSGGDSGGSLVDVEVSSLNAPRSGASVAPPAPQNVLAGANTPIAQSSTIINNPIVERVIEVQRLLAVGGISEDILNRRLEQLDNKLSSQMFSLSAANSTVVAQNYTVTAQTNKIDQLNSVAISNATITGGSISGASVSATSVSTGDLSAGNTTLASTTVTGNLSVGGSLNLTGTSGSITATNATITNATTTNFYSVLGHFTTGVIDTLTSTLSTIASLTATELVATNATSTNFYTSTLGAVTASTTNLTFQTAVGGNATTTNLFSTTASSTNLFSTNFNLGVGTLGNATTTTLFSTTASSTNLFSQSATIGTLTLASLSSGTTTLTNLAVTNTSTSTFAGGFTIAGSGFVYQQATGRVGIGTTSPFAKFAVHAKSGETNSLLFEVASSTASATSSLFSISNTGLTTLLNLSMTAGTTTNFFSTTASSTNLYSTNLNAGTVTLGHATTTTLFSTTASSTNLYSMLAYLGTVTLNSETVSGLSTFASGFVSQASSTVVGAFTTTGANVFGSTLNVSGLTTLGQASTTLFSSYGPAYFGGSATSSFSTDGTLTLAKIFAANGTTGTSTIASGQGFTVGSSQLVVQQGSGNVGIGTTGPGAPLHVVTRPASTNSVVEVMRISRFTSGTAAVGMGGSLDFYGELSTGQEDVQLAQIAGVHENVMTGAFGGLAFYTRPNASTVERMRITNDGNVGIGTTGPTGKLHIKGSGTLDTLLRLTLSNAGGGSYGIVFADINEADKSKISIDSADTTDLQFFTGTAMRFYTGSNLTSTGERMRITSTGNVGLGTTTPGSILSIQNVGNFVASATSTLYNGLQAAALNITGASTLANTIISSATSTNLFSTTASSTNLYAQAASVGTLAASGAATLSSTLNLSGLGTLASGFVSQASSTVVGAFTTTGANVFGSTLNVSGLTTLGQASTTLFSSYGPAYFGGSATSSFSNTGVLTLGTALAIASGGTATTTQVTNGVNYFDGTRITSGTALTYDGTKFTAPFASSTALSVSGVGYFGTASTTNLTVSSLTLNRVPYIAAAGAFTDSSNLTFDGTTLTPANLTVTTNTTLSNLAASRLVATDGSKVLASTITAGNLLSSVTGTTGSAGNLVFSTSPTISTPTITGLANMASASTTLFSSYGPAYFGGSATSSFSTDGTLTLAKIFAANGTTGTSTIASGQGFTVGSSQLVVQQGSGNVGIGTTGPNDKLEVYGGNLRLRTTVNGANGFLSFTDTAGAAQANIYYYNGLLSLDDYVHIRNSDGNVGIGTTSPYSRLSVWGGGTGATAMFELTNSASTTLASVLNDGTFYMKGNVGIGTTTPGSILSIQGVGNFVASATSTLYNGLSVPTLNVTGASTLANTIITNATTTNLFSTTASSTNLYAQAASVGTLAASGAATLSSTLNLSGLGTFASGFVSQASSTIVGAFTSTGNATFGGTLAVNGLCVTGDTKLRRRRKRRRADGTEEEYFEDVRIDEIKSGDEILTLNEKTGTLVVSRVKELMDMGVKDIFELVTATGKRIKTTGNHPYLVAPKGIGKTKNSDLSAGATLTRSIVLIDYANIKAWARSKGVAIDLEALKAVLSFCGVARTSIYYGADAENKNIAKFMRKLRAFGYEVVSKPIQYFRITLTELLEQYVNARWVNALRPNAHRELVAEAERLDAENHSFLVPKANFDVEITMDIMRAVNEFDHLILFSGDGDFAPLISHLKVSGKQTTVVSGREFLAGSLHEAANIAAKLEDIVKLIPGLVYPLGPDGSYKKPTPAHEERVWENCVPSIADLLGLSSTGAGAVDNQNDNRKGPRRGHHGQLSPALPILAQVHPFVKGGSWKKVVDIREGMMIATKGANGKPQYERVVEINRLPAEQVWDIEVEGTHNFLGNGIVAHNTALFNQASTTLFSSYGPAYFGATATSSFSNAGVLTLASALAIASGGTATTTQVTNGVNYFDGTRITSGTALTYDGTKFTAPFASSTALSVSGVGYFGTASSTNLTVSSLTLNRVPYITTSGAFTDSANLTFNGTTLTPANLTVTASTTLSNLTANRLVATDGSKILVSTITAGNLLSSVTGTTGSAGNLVFSTSPTIATPTVTGLATMASASTTLFSSYGPAYFGATATSSFDTAGNLSVAGTLGVTGNTTLANATTTNLFSTTASSTNLFSQTATIGALTANTLTVNSTFTQTGLATFTNGFLSNASSTITSGLFSMNGGASTTNITASGTGYFGSLGGAAVSSLTANYLPKWNSGTFANSLLYDTGTNVGIGTTSPTSKLEVAGNTFFGGNLTATGTVLVSEAARTSGSSPFFSVAGGADTGLTAATESPDVQFNLARVKTHANGNIALERSFLINAPTEAFTSMGAGLVTDLATVGITGAPLLGNFATSTNSHTLYMGASALNASTTNSYGLTVNANTGAANNYAAAFLGGNVGLGTTTPGSILSIQNVGNFVASATSTLYNGLSVPTFNATGLSTLANTIITNATTTNLFSTTASSTNLYSTSATFGVLSANSAALTSATTTNLFSTTASSTNLYAQAASVGTLAASGATTLSSTLNVTGLATLGQASTTLFSSYGPAYFGGTGTSTFSSAGALTLSPAARASGSGALLAFTGPSDTGLTAGTEAADIQFNLARTKTHANGNIALERSFLLNAPTEAMTSMGAGLFTDLATFGITGAPLLGNFATSTNSHTLLLGASALNASTTNSYGLTVNANTGAANNYSAQFLGGSVGIGTTTPGSILSIQNVGNFVASATSTLYNGLSVATLNATGLSTLANTIISSATSTNLFSTTASSTNLYSTSATFGVLSANSAALTSATTTNFFSTTASSTNLFSQTATIGSLTLGNALAITSGGTGLASYTANRIIYTDAAGTAFAQVATSSLNIGGNAGTATTLQTARNINSVSFNGSADITITAASSTLLANNNTFSGLNTFSNATTTLHTSTTSWIGTLNLTNALSVANGGTGASTLTGCLTGNGTGAITGSGTCNTSNASVSSIATTYPVTGGTITTTGTIALAFGTTTANLWDLTQTFTKAIVINEGTTATSTFAGNVSVAGNLKVDGAFFAPVTLVSSGNATINGTLTVTGATTLANASTTQLTISGSSWLGTPLALVGTNITGTGASFTAGKATVLETARTINGVSFDGSANITVASTTLLANNNTWTGLNTFSNATTTLHTSTNSWIGTLNLTNALTVANGGTGASTLTGCLTGNGTGAITGSGTCNTSAATVTSVATTYPVTGGTFTTSGTIALAFGTTTSNTWAGTQTFGTISNTGGYTQSGTTANTFTGTPTFSNATYSALFTGGNVGIGTTNPSGLLHLQGATGGTTKMTINSGTSNTWEFGTGLGGIGAVDLGIRDVTASVAVMTFKAGGNVGIGTTGPGAPLHVVTRPASTNSVVEVMRISRFTSGTAAVGMGGSLDFYGELSTGQEDVQLAQIAGVHENVMTGAFGGLAFYTRPNASTVERMRITNDGNVGIGTTGPDGKLHVMTASAGTVTADVNADDLTVENSGVGGISILTPAASDGNLYFGNPTENGTARITREATTGHLKFSFQTGVGNMILQQSGNVGIGTTTPGQLLTLGGANPVELIRGSSNAFLQLRGDGNTANSRLMEINSLNDGLTFASYLDTGAGKNANIMVVKSDGNVGIGTTNPGAKLDIANGNMTLVIGADSGADTRTNATGKLSRIGSYHYTNAEEPVGLILTNNTATENIINFGGASSLFNAATSLHFFTAANTTTLGGTERMVIDTSGNVGIGTTSPVSKLDIVGTSTSGGGTVQTLRVAGGSGGNASITINGDSTTQYAYQTFAQGGVGKFEIGYSATSDAAGSLFYFNPTVQVGTVGASMVIKSGNVGIGTTSPSTILQIAGAITPNADNTYTDGNATYRWSAVYAANGTIQTSDVRLKDNIADLTYGLPEILKLRPVLYTWKSQPGQGVKFGFVAQEVQPVMPELVDVGDDAAHTLGLSYTSFVPVLVKAVQELDAKIADVASSTASQMEKLNAQVNFGTGTTTPAEIAASSFASASATLRGLVSGLGDIIVQTFHDAVYAVTGIFNKVFAQEVHTDQLCVSDSSGETCITRAQLDALLAGQTASAATPDLGVSPPSTGGVSSDTATTTDIVAPVITVQGNNPANIMVGDTYGDLGALVSDNVDQNLGIYASLDGGATTTPEQIILDTSAAAAHEVIYSATDQAGNTGYATRTVNVLSPLSIVVVDTTATSTGETGGDTSQGGGVTSDSAATSTTP